MSFIPNLKQAKLNAKWKSGDNHFGRVFVDKWEILYSICASYAMSHIKPDIC